MNIPEHGPIASYQLHVYFDKEENEFISRCEEFPYLMCFGDTIGEAIREIGEVIETAMMLEEDTLNKVE